MKMGQGWEDKGGRVERLGWEFLEVGWGVSMDRVGWVGPNSDYRVGYGVGHGVGWGRRGWEGVGWVGGSVRLTWVG